MTQFSRHANLGELANEFVASSPCGYLVLMGLSRRIFLTGGSGFVGRAVIRELIGRGLDVVALIHRRSLLLDSRRVREVQADLLDANSLARAMHGCGAVIHLVGIIRQNFRMGATFERMHTLATRSIVDAASQAGVGRFVQMSAIGARPDATSAYHRSKWGGEEAVRSSGLRWTIIRPSLIVGPEGEFVRMASRWASRGPIPLIPLPFMPYFGRGFLGAGGAGLLQPIRVEDVARAFVDALSNDASIGRTYEIGGAEVMSWPTLYRKLAIAAVGRRRRAVPIPTWYAGLLTRIVPAALLPFNRDQIIMSQEDNVASDMAGFEEDFGWRPAPL